MSDSVNKPAHYQFAGFEVIDLIRDAVTHVSDAFAATLYGNVIKYVFRWPRKDGVRDLKKARWYLDRLITRLEGVTVPPSPGYDPASMAFRHGDVDTSYWYRGPHPARLREEQRLCDSFGDQQARKQRTAAEIANADGVSEYGNPVAPWGTNRD